MELVEAGRAATGQCYVCFDDGAPPSVCACKDRYVHIQCVLKAIEASGKPECSVCTQPLDAVKLESSCRLTCRAWRFVALAVVFPGLLGVSIVRSENWLSDPKQGTNSMHTGRAVETVFQLVGTVILALYCGTECLHYRRGHWRLLKVQAKWTTTR